MSATKVERAAPSGSTDATAATPVFSASVLLVDDQPGRLLSYEAILAGLGVHCVRTMSGAEALERLQQQPFAVILLDVNMPGMDGFEVARRIRADPRIERTPIIFVTAGDPNESDRLKGYEVGAIDYISVPIVPEILRSKVAVLVELHQRRSELLEVNRALNAARSQADHAHASTRAEHEALLRAMLDHPSELMVVMQAVRGGDAAVVDFVYRNANTAALELLGRTRETLLGRTLSEVLSERAARLIPACAGVLATRTPLRYEIDAMGRDFLITLFASGTDTVVSSGVDITERKRVEKALHESRERLRLAQAAARLGIHDWDVRSGTIHWDERTHELWGTAPDEAITFDTFLGGVLAEDRARLRQGIDAALDPAGDGQYLMQFRVLHRRDGKTRWIEAAGRVTFEDGRAARLVGTVRDVTARARAEKRLRESEERFRELANNMQQCAWTCDADGNRDWFNDRWYDYTGSTFEQMRGQGWRATHHPDHLGRVLQRLQDGLDAGRAWEDTFPLRGRDGTYRWFLTQAVPVRTENGKVVRWFGTNTDITAQRELQEALQLADRRKDEFLAMLAHELRNPVAPIANAAEVLALLLRDNQQRSLAQIIQRQASHLARLLDDLLDVARITRGRIELRRETVALQSCIDLAVETAEPLLRAANHRFAVSVADRSLLVEGDRVRIAQCVSNLLGNAAKYTAPGGEIALRTFADDGNAVIEVSDNGIGIAPEFLPHMFDLFAQGTRALDRSAGGLGIGLSVCKQLIERHGGSISARSAGAGCGATFTLQLPLQAASAA